MLKYVVYSINNIGGLAKGWFLILDTRQIGLIWENFI